MTTPSLRPDAAELANRLSDLSQRKLTSGLVSYPLPIGMANAMSEAANLIESQARRIGELEAKAEHRLAPEIITPMERAQPFCPVPPR